MIRCKKESIEWLEFEQLQEFPNLVHGVFLRHGGVSQGAFGSLNLGGGTGDLDESIAENRSRVSEILGLETLVSSKQVHGVHLESVPSSSPLIETGCDGLVTCQPELGLLIKHADCQAAIFFDPIKRVVANIHCGWRGNVQNIYAKTVATLKQQYDCNPADLLVCISPSLGPENAQFIHYETELPEEFHPFQVSAQYFDFWQIAKMQLRGAGILEDHIEMAKICTSAGEEDFFSYRRDKNTGRHGTVIALKQTRSNEENPLTF